MKKHICLILFLVGCFSFSFGQINILDQRKRDVLFQQIDETTKKLEDANKNVAASLQQLNLIKQKVAVRKKYISALKNEITGLENEIRVVQEDIKDMADDLNREKEHYAQVLKGMQKNRYHKNKLLYILSAKSVTQSYRRFEYLKGIYASQKKQLTAVKEKQAGLIQKEKELDLKRSEKVALLDKQHVEDVKLFDEEKKQKTIVDGLLHKQGELQAELNRQKQQSIELNEQIAGTISAVENTERETKPAGETKADNALAASNEHPVVDDFEKNKGRLPMPVSGQYLVIGKFGEQLYEELKQATVTNGGINIQAKSNNDVKAVYAGEVSSVFSSAGYHYTVIIRHGAYLTIYSKLSSVSVEKGSRVMAGQSIGKIYTDPDVGDMAILHFQIRKGKTQLNPEIWLR